MQDKKLLEVDIRIAKLRDKIAAGNGEINDGPEIDRLIEQRMSLLHAMAVTLRNHRPPIQNESVRT